MQGFAECYVHDESELDFTKAAILIIDMLNDFCKEGGAMVLKEGMEVVAPLNKLIMAFREKGLPIIYVNDSHRPDKTDQEFAKRQPHCLEGTWGAQLIDELTCLETDYCIKKRRFSGFFQTDLDLVLRELGVKTVVATGVVTNICVRSTCHDAFFNGYKVVVPQDCVRATGEREQRSSLWDIETHFGTVTTSDMIIRKILGNK